MLRITIGHNDKCPKRWQMTAQKLLWYLWYMISNIVSIICRLRGEEPSLLARYIGTFTGPNIVARHRELVAAAQPPPAKFARNPEFRIVCREAGNALPGPTQHLIPRKAGEVVPESPVFQRLKRHVEIASRRQLAVKAA
jgi:hypothetical protein